MRISPFEIYKEQTKRPTAKKVSSPKDDTIKGVLLNNYIKKHENREKIDDFDRISNELLIPQNFDIPLPIKKEDKKEDFNYKKALMPVMLTTGISLLGLSLISVGVKNYSKVLANKQDIVRPQDLARNINIVEEPHFAMYRMLREPNTKNMFGLIGVVGYSFISMIAKNFVDGAKDVWTKKQNCDIEHDFQENLIEVETEEFSGKLNVVNELLSDTTKYFKSVLSKDEKRANFDKFLNFQGEQNKIEEENQNKKENKNKIIKPLLSIIGITGGIIGLSFLMFKNYQKTVKNLDTFVEKFEHNKIQTEINNAIQEKEKTTAIKKLVDIFKVINANEDKMRDSLSKIKGIKEDEITKAIKDVSSAQIYAKAPEALGGITEKIQYYCYINEDRGHLYNWILNPENKFNKYLFLSFSMMSMIGYVAKQASSAIKDVIVNKENSKSELNLKKRLVDTEIRNFKAKKLSAINPQIDNFIYQLEEQKRPKKELKDLAENILVEIKTGPPYVYS